jgi:sarcosine oxidase
VFLDFRSVPRVASRIGGYYIRSVTTTEAAFYRREKRLANPTYDVAVIGAGVFGAWTAYVLQRAGLQVALLDAYGPGNSRSSSGDESRIIRMSYGPEEIYTRWSWRSLARWKEFEQSTGRQIFHRTGVLLLAPPELPHTLASVEILRKVGVPFEMLERPELEQRYPQFNFGEITWALYEPESGALLARRAVYSVTQAAVKAGVTYLPAAALPPSGAGELPELATRAGAHVSAGQFVFACGPWLPKLFPELLAERIHPTRQEVFYFGAPAGDLRFAPPQMPAWIDFSHEFYGLPELEHRGFKVALDRHGAAFDPDTGDRQVSAEALQEVREFLAERFPALAGAPLVESRVCQYENTSNGDFLIDRHPELRNVWLVGGGSGHGFKHGPALGEYVAARIVEGGAVEPRFTLATKATVRQRSVY